ncbi:MAG: hypothetical protein ABR533_04930, partial [Desulfonatronovibrio sp.]
RKYLKDTSGDPALLLTPRNRPCFSFLTLKLYQFPGQSEGDTGRGIMQRMITKMRKLALAYKAMIYHLRWLCTF